MKVSIITAAYNNKETIEQCINSVYSQNYSNIEHIIIDGRSTDGTAEILKNNEDKITKWISEPDEGIYYALNKGLKMATGDIIGFLHSDDVYYNNKVIDLVVSKIINFNIDSCYGDLLYVNKKNLDRIIRYWKSCSYREGLIKRGWMPPHPTFFVKKDIYDKYGIFDTNFKIAADYELILRFFEKNKISTHYIPHILVKMRVGGTSNRDLNNIIRKASEDYRAFKMNNLGHGLYAVALKNLSKIPQFLKMTIF